MNLKLQAWRESMAEDKKQQTQKINQNGRPVLVLSHETFKTAASVGQTTTDWIGELTTGTKIIEQNNFHWGLLHSTTTPAISKERLKEILKFKMYEYNPETGKVFQGNQNRQVSNIKKVTEKIDKVTGPLGGVSDFGELAVALAEKDAKAVAQKASTMVISKAEETLGVAIAGKCSKFAATRVDPKRMVVVGAACYMAWHYSTGDMSNLVANKVGATDPAINTAAAMIKAIDIVDTREQTAEKKRKEKEAIKDPMSIWHITGSD